MLTIKIEELESKAADLRKHLVKLQELAQKAPAEQREKYSQMIEEQKRVIAEIDSDLDVARGTVKFLDRIREISATCPKHGQTKARWADQTCGDFCRQSYRVLLMNCGCSGFVDCDCERTNWQEAAFVEVGVGVKVRMV
jgi:hypothetical protein